jgi:methionyl-tRNA synthetase
MQNQRKILVTSALPYANGEIHIGHLVEYIQTDIWVRFQKMMGHECVYICADDTHGTPIMIRAQKEGITPEELVGKMHTKHAADFYDFEIRFDNYYSTNSPENKMFAEMFYEKMKQKKHIDIKDVEQLYCPHDKMFLPDRFVKGTCPKCKSTDQYGDNCEKCSATYSTAEVLDPKCSVCGTTPIRKKSEHYFFQLSHFKEFLSTWVKDHLSQEIQNKLGEWLSGELRDWDISRDAPYFGFQIPGTDNKYFYVWVDAPIGYISSTKNWCDKNKRNYEDFWKNDKAEIYHFIGKDILYFHTLFWPAMLKTAEFNTPKSVFVHGFLTVNGEKMSKSKGTFINAREYLNHLSPGFLRYYYACKLGPDFDDLDLSFTDFENRVNSDLIGKITNLASRLAPMINKKFENKLGKLDSEGQTLVYNAKEKANDIATLFEERKFARATILIRQIADEANKYIDSKEPWKLLKTDLPKAYEVITAGLNVFRLIAIYLTPILPKYSLAVSKLFKENDYRWKDSQVTLEDHEIDIFEHLAQRVDPALIAKLLDASRLPEESVVVPESPKVSFEPLAPEISIDDFKKIDLRVGKILEATSVIGADKLLQLKIDVGFATRNVFAGIKSAYKPEDLVGKLVAVVANLQPRKMKFGMSEGMVIAAGPGGKEIWLLSPDNGAKPGDKIQ